MSAGHQGPPERTPFTSSFSTRPLPTLPPASQAYEPLVKAQLKHRLNHTVFVHSAVFSLALHTLLASSGDTGTVAHLFNPRAWLVACLAWAFGVLPVIVLRKVSMTASVTAAPSPKATFAGALSKPATRLSIVIYVSSAVLLLALHMYYSSPVLESLRLGIFLRSRKHPYYLNGSFIFLFVAQVWFALCFAQRNIMRERFVFRWLRSTLSNPSTIIGSIPILFITIGLFTLFSLVAYNAAFGFFKMLILPFLLRIPLLRGILRPLTLHFVRGHWTVTLPIRHFSLETRTFTLGLITLANWEFAETLFDTHIPQPVKVAHATADQNVTLISGVTSTDPIFLHFAYSELRDLATDDSSLSSARRTALFSDQKHNPSVWSTLVREALLRLGQDYQTLLRRGEPVPPPPPAPTPPAPKLPDPPPTPILRQPIHRPPQQSPLSRVLDAFASDSELSKAAEQVAVEVETSAKEARVPELFRSVATTAVTAIPASSVIASAVQGPSMSSSAIGAPAKRGCSTLIVTYAPALARDAVLRLDEWWTRERVHKRSEMSLPNRDLDALIAESLSALVCASLTEDRYGVVQRDIPRILEAFVSFLCAVEDFQAEVRALVPPTPEEVAGGDTTTLQATERIRVEVAKAMEVTSVVGDALGTGVRDIMRTFEDKLSAFKFPPKTAKKLQTFVDYM